MARGAWVLADDAPGGRRAWRTTRLADDAPGTCLPPREATEEDACDICPP